MKLFDFRTEACQKLLSSPQLPKEQRDKNTVSFIANQLLRHYVGREYSDSIFDKDLPEDCIGPLTDALEQKLAGRPLQYILGEWEFYGLRMFCGEGCLIPRPETEHLAEFLIKKLPRNSFFLDLCTGSGCIPVAVLKNRSDVHCVAVDISEDALKFARRNAEYHGVSSRMEIICCDAADFTPDEKFDIISSNPPYIKSADMDSLSDEVLQEPHIALDGGCDGLDFYRLIVSRFKNALTPCGYFAFETGEDTAEGTSEILASHGFYPQMIPDYSGIFRVVTGTKTRQSE
ncbi:MAG: peptide chain release factor N(5)-glutamine methyltransferase [Clostridia bacterium]|nr:peptide chain release factor N(5)-glutamine methyltransferase [Clostridia bacterium]